MVNYTCFQCGYVAKQKIHFLNHLSRKNPCKIILKETTISDNITKNNIDASTFNRKTSSKTSSFILKNLKKHPHLSSLIYDKSLNNICKFCSKTLSNYKNKWRHEKTCKAKSDLTKIEKLTEENNELLKMIHKMSNKSSGNNSNNLTNNSNNNNTVNIQINNFDEEKVDYFSEKLKLKLAKNYRGMITKFVNLLHFNEKHPENHTIRLKDKKSGLGEIRENNDWKYVDMEDFLNKIHINLIDKLYEIRDIVKEENLSKFDKWYDDVEKLIDNELIEKGIKKKIKLASINGTNKLNNL